MAVYAYRKGDDSYPSRGNLNDSEQLASAVQDALRYRPPDGDAWTAHTVVCYIREHENMNGIRQDSFDGWDIERIVAEMVANGNAVYVEGGGE